ncbi:MAG: hypothetical protein ABF968_05890 [Acetobacter sp.]|uniref:hypothetical protein n=1 Tax=Acetobacter sp. TaxID=440 RepID=UPI0039E76929
MQLIPVLRKTAGFVAACGLCCGFFTATPACAEAFDSKDVTILGEALHFVVPPPKGEISVAVVYNPAVTGSEQEAQQISKAFSDTSQNIGVTMHAFAVRLDDLNHNAFVAVVSANGAGTPILRNALTSHHAVCVTGHLDQVENGSCQIYLTSQPTVDIRLNQDATDAADVHFATAFRIMVRTL